MVHQQRPIIWIISNHHWTRASIRAELMERGFDASGYEEAAQALAVLGSSKAERPRFIILDLRESNVTEIQLSNLEHAEIPMMAIGGNLEFAEPAIHNFPWTEMMKVPVSIGEICNSVERRISRLPQQ